MKFQRHLMNLSAALIGLAFTAGSANAASVVWTVGTFTDETSLQSNITSAFNFSPVGTGSLSVDGIVFVEANDTGGTSNGITIATTANSEVTGKWNPDPYSGNANFETIADSGSAGSGVRPITLSGLTVGVQYSAQFGATYDGLSTREMAYSDTGFSNVAGVYTAGGSNTGWHTMSDYNLFTAVFTADDTGAQTFYMSARDIEATGNARGAIANFLTVAVVPEPSAALLGGIGLLFLLRRRRA